MVLTNLCHIMNGTELYNRYKEKLFLGKGTAYNNCIPGFNELYEMINTNKEMFANFCDFPNPLRDMMKYLDVYRYTLIYAHRNNYRYEELDIDTYASLSMYNRFCRVNQDVLDVTVPSSDGNVTNIRKVLKHTPPKVYRQMIDNMLDSLL